MLYYSCYWLVISSSKIQMLIEVSRYVTFECFYTTKSYDLSIITLIYCLMFLAMGAWLDVQILILFMTAHKIFKPMEYISLIRTLLDMVLSRHCREDKFFLETMIVATIVMTINTISKLVILKTKFKEINHIKLNNSNNYNSF